MGSTASRTWKKFESRAAAFFGCRRTPLSGSNSAHTCSDSLSPDFFLECKLRQKFEHHSLYAAAAPLAKKEGKIPVVVTQRKHSPSFLVTVDKDHLLRFCIKFLTLRGYRVVKTKHVDNGVKGSLTSLKVVS